MFQTGADGLFQWFRRQLPRADAHRPQTLLVDVAQWRAVLPAAGALLDHAEMERVARKRFAKDRELLLLAYALHRMWLAVLLACAPAQVPLRRNEHGRPLLQGERLQTSLSHCDGAIALTVSSTGEIGVDIEPRSRASEMRDVAAQVCHPLERLEVERLPALEQGDLLLRLWVRKEALLKAAGVGLGWEMSSFEAPPGRVVDFSRSHAPVLQVMDLQTDCNWVVALSTPPGPVGTCVWLSPGD